MSIITYPLDGVTYSAEDVATYLCTRTSGVYAKDSNFAVSITGTRQITIAPGLAWINYDDFKGVSVCSREDTVLTVPDADNTLNRVDRVVLQFDTSSNLTAIRLKTGTPAVAAQPPAILQNHNQYELGLCTVSVPAGSSVVTAADITDTRADEAVCGLMRDSVTGIPTAQLQAQALAIMTQLSTELHTKLDALDAAIAAVESGSFYTKAEADAKFGTPYSLPAATVSTLGGVKVGDYLDIAADGTLSGKTLNDKIAAAVAVKSEARLVWSQAASTPKKWMSHEISIPDGVDYLTLHAGTSSEIQLARGGSWTYTYKATEDSVGSVNLYLTFRAEGTLHVNGPYTNSNYNGVVTFYLSGYHYPTIAELLTETQAAQADTDALAVDQEYRVAMLELGLTDDTTTDTTT
nr:MAG TPA: Receptor Binding Protein [Caudoviricetes sp.]